MGLLGKKGGAPALDARSRRERAYVMTGVGYTAWPAITHPDDAYIGVPAAPTFDRAYQGWQKENALALAQWGWRHPGWGVDVPGTEVFSPYVGNTMQRQTAWAPTVNKVPAAHLGTIGPGMAWVPNPTAPAASYFTPSAPWWRTALGKLGFGG